MNWPVDYDSPSLPAILLYWLFSQWPDPWLCDLVFWPVLSDQPHPNSDSDDSGCCSLLVLANPVFPSTIQANGQASLSDQSNENNGISPIPINGIDDIPSPVINANVCSFFFPTKPIIKPIPILNNENE